MADITSANLMMMYNSNMTFEDIEDRFKNEVSKDVWDEFLTNFRRRIEYSVNYHAKNLSRCIKLMRKQGYSDEQISFHGRIEFVDPSGSTIRLRGI